MFQREMRLTGVVLGLLAAFGVCGGEAAGCLGSMNIAATSSGFLDGGSTSLVLSYGGVDAEYDDSWISRGFNVAVFDSNNAVTSTGTFDIYTAAAQSDAMLSFLQGVTDGSLVAVLVDDTAQFWDDSDRIGADLKAYMASEFNSASFGPIEFRANYALLAVKGGAALAEEAPAAGAGVSSVGVDGVSCTVAVPVPLPTPMPTGSFPTAEPTACLGDIAFSGISAGFSDGNIASLMVTYGGVDSGYDDSWMSRGFNVVSFNPIEYSVWGSAHFDTYESAAESTSLLSFLLSVPDGSLVVVLVMDTPQHWDPAVVNVGSDLTAYMGSVFGATQVNGLGFRESYGLVGFKGGSPLMEAKTASGTGSVAVTASVPCVTPAPSYSRPPSLLPTATPTPKPSVRPTPLPTYVPSPVPTPVPTPVPSEMPTPEPTIRPSPAPTPMCTEGQYHTMGSGACQYCEPGTYQPLSGQNMCLNCPAGQHQSSYGALECNPCSLGHYCPEGSAAETECSAGSYSGTFASACTNCTAGRFQPEVKQTACFACRAGEYASSGSKACSLCDVGRYQPAAGQPECPSCAVGWYTDKMGDTNCTECTAGYACPALDDNVIVPCQAGTFSLAGAASCTNCAAGRYTSTSLATSCTSCGAGRYQEVLGSTSCKTCVAGYMCKGGDASFDACAPGEYSPPGATGCTQCPLGKATEFSGSSACLSCSPGRSAGTLGLTACDDCIPGYYQINGGQGACDECPAGYYQDSYVATGCKPCPVGYECPNKNMDAPEECAACSFAGSITSRFCTACAEGKCAISTISDPSECEWKPTPLPTINPSSAPTGPPSIRPTSQPSIQPSELPTTKPIQEPTSLPSSRPSPVPSSFPSEAPTAPPSQEPSSEPTAAPSIVPTSMPTPEPTFKPTSLPTSRPTPLPSSAPSILPTALPTLEPTFQPTSQPVPDPTPMPTYEPTPYPTYLPSSLPTLPPTQDSCDPGFYRVSDMFSLIGDACSVVDDCFFSPGFDGITDYPELEVCSFSPLFDGTLNVIAFGVHAGDELFIEDFVAGTSSGYAVGVTPQGLTVNAGDQIDWRSNTDGSTNIGFKICLTGPGGGFSYQYENTYPVGQCAPCREGYFQDEEDQFACDACPIGQFQSNVNASTCHLCEPGYFQNNEAATGCQACYPGTYEGNTGSSDCEPCPAGYKCPNPAQTSYSHLCSPGTYSVGGATDCSTCAVGKTSGVGASSCL